MVAGERSARGMELVTRSEARGRVLVSFGRGTEAGDWGGEGGGGCGERDSWAAAASSHAARAEGSIGHVGGGGEVGGGGDWLEELDPMAVGLESRQCEKMVKATELRICQAWSRGLAAESSNEDRE